MGEWWRGQQAAQPTRRGTGADPVKHRSVLRRNGVQAVPCRWEVPNPEAVSSLLETVYESPLTTAIRPRRWTNKLAHFRVTPERSVTCTATILRRENGLTALNRCLSISRKAPGPLGQRRALPPAQRSTLWGSLRRAFARKPPPSMATGCLTC